MKRFGFISTAVLFLLMGITASVSAQQDDREKPPAQPAAHDEQANPPEEKRAPEGKPAQEEEKRTQQDDKKAQDDKKVQNDEKREQKNDKQEQDKQVQDQQKQQQKDDKRAQQGDKNRPQARPAGNDAHRASNNGGGRIPDDKFRSNFGRDHHFRMSRPTVVSGQPRFQYGGYWFGIGDAWPVGWDYSDDCYIDYVDGEYLLFDLAHPGASIVVNVVL
ncbi:MAG TPA: hypothetical protein VH079_07655 [Terriglobales bacterium]|nr:hypothetical protein [Terriglobales bacterium]